jgi:signal-transduction protein with cAMP-binding, CBS, and nucleotidyltransferase domain
LTRRRVNLDTMTDLKNLLKEIKAYRNDMVARGYPFQEISNIITKWEMKLSVSGKPDPFFSKEPINSPMSDE